jgi:hypothetical protein
MIGAATEKMIEGKKKRIGRDGNWRHDNISQRKENEKFSFCLSSIAGSVCYSSTKLKSKVELFCWTRAPRRAGGNEIVFDTRISCSAELIVKYRHVRYRVSRALPCSSIIHRARNSPTRWNLHF